MAKGNTRGRSAEDGRTPTRFTLDHDTREQLFDGFYWTEASKDPRLKHEDRFWRAQVFFWFCIDRLRGEPWLGYTTPEPEAAFLEHAKTAKLRVNPWNLIDDLISGITYLENEVGDHRQTSTSTKQALLKRWLLPGEFEKFDENIWISDKLRSEHQFTLWVEHTERTTRRFEQDYEALYGDPDKKEEVPQKHESQVWDTYRYINGGDGDLEWRRAQPPATYEQQHRSVSPSNEYENIEDDEVEDHSTQYEDTEDELVEYDELQQQDTYELRGHSDPNTLLPQTTQRIIRDDPHPPDIIAVSVRCRRALLKPQPSGVLVIFVIETASDAAIKLGLRGSSGPDHVTVEIYGPADARRSAMHLLIEYEEQLTVDLDEEQHLKIGSVRGRQLEHYYGDFGT